MGFYVDDYEIRKHFNIQKKGFNKIFTEIKENGIFNFCKINLNHKYSAIEFSVIRLIHSVAEEYNLSTRATMIKFTESSQICQRYSNSLRKRIDKQFTYFIVIKFNPNIDRDSLSDFIVGQGPLNSQEETENLNKSYFRMKKDISLMEN